MMYRKRYFLLYAREVILFVLFSLDVDECAGSPCKNGAKCSNIHGSYLCSCKAGFTGKNCDAG